MMELPCPKLGGMLLAALHTITVSAIFISHLVILQLSWRLSYSVPKPTVARRHGAYCRHRSHSRSRCRCHGRCRCRCHCRRHGGQLSSKGKLRLGLALYPHPKRRLRAVSVMAAVIEMAFRAATKFVKMFCELTK